LDEPIYASSLNEGTGNWLDGNGGPSSTKLSPFRTKGSSCQGENASLSEELRIFIPSDNAAQPHQPTSNQIVLSLQMKRRGAEGRSVCTTPDHLVAA
jgi:hypothetical protein